MWVGIECWYRTCSRARVESFVERVVVVGHASLDYDYYHPHFALFVPSTCMTEGLSICVSHQVGTQTNTL